MRAEERASPCRAATSSGLTVNFGTGGDLAGTCANQGYTGRLLLPEPHGAELPRTTALEVVDRVGNDSFAPGHGVLLSKSREQRHAARLDDRPEPARTSG